MKRPLIIGNWKLYVQTRDAAEALSRGISRGAPRVAADLVVCPPAPFISIVGARSAKAGISFGA